MKKVLIYLHLSIFFFLSCKKTDLAPIVNFDSLDKGAYIRLLNKSNTNINLVDLADSAIEYSIEFVDLEQGKLVSEYQLMVSFRDKNLDNGDQSTKLVLLDSWADTDFGLNQNGFQGIENIKITASEVIKILGLEVSEILPEDQFIFEGIIITKSGQTFGRNNSTAVINGASFRGFFNFQMTAFCPSDLAGTYTHFTSASSITCGENRRPIEQDLLREIEIITLGDGVYKMNEWSFGLYDLCYGEKTILNSCSLQFTEYCKRVSFTGTVDSWGDIWTFDSFVNNEEWTISWENTYGEAGTTIIYNERGWDFVIAK